MARIGWGACGVCGNAEASITKNDLGTLSVRCHRCEYSGFAKAGTKAARLIAAGMTPDADAAPDVPPVAKPAKAAPGVAAKPEPKPLPAPPPKRVPSSVFDLGQL